MRTHEPLSAHKFSLIIKSILLIFALISMRLFYLQISLTQYFVDKSTKNFLYQKHIRSPRGNILDCHGTLLATNRPAITLTWQGTGNPHLTDQQHKLLHIISKILCNCNADIDTIESAERKKKSTPIATDINLNALSQIEEQLPNHPNITITTYFERYYPYGSYASHILGYLGQSNIQMQGRMGLEKLFDTTLKGQDGTTLNVINSAGRQIKQTTIKHVLTGDNIKTTLDISLQTVCEQVFPKKYAGAMIIMNPHDGAIRALVSRPTFDPTIFLAPIAQNEWQMLQKEHPFLNRAWQAAYPPGSIFKLVTLSAALEHNLIDITQPITCNGYTLFANRTYWCNNRQGHGTLSILQAIAQSCNPPFYEIGKQIDIDLLAEYAQRFGLGNKTNILFSEKTGLVPTKAWKRQYRGERWWQGETLAVAIGQSFLLVTPIQVARMIASIFTGYLVMPRILVHEPVQHIPLAIKPTTQKFLQKSMKMVATVGTGRRVSTIKDMVIHAKTSTAQTSAMHKRKLGPVYLEHGWFASHIQYKNQTPLVIVILVEHAGTARVATTIAKQFLVRYKKLMDKRW